MHNENVPSRNTVKQYASNSYYHVYSRGVAKQPIFRSTFDYTVFASLFKRYLSPRISKNVQRRLYPNYSQRLDLVAYALMPNHIHLLVYQSDELALQDFMKALLTSYSMYFNKTYKRVGPLFQSRYKASLIDAQNYLEHISRYIHLNPPNWKTSNKTSLVYYVGKQKADWINPEAILGMFRDEAEYLSFLGDYEGYKHMLEELKWELANEDIK